jgi:glycine/D-amino acid oxidase-like deaminating enzyme
LPQHFTDLRTVKVEQEWIGIMGFSKDRNPLVGPLPNRPGEYIAAGFTGHGMPMTFFAGQNVADMIAGKEPEPFVAEAFLPTRFMQ